MGKKARNLRSEIRRQKQGGGKWEIDQKITSLGFIQMKSIFVKILRNVHIVHNMKLCWPYELESQKGNYYWKLLFYTWCLFKQNHLHTNQLFGDSARDFHSRSRIWIDKYVPANKTEKKRSWKWRKHAVEIKTPVTCKICVKFLSHLTS